MPLRTNAAAGWDLSQRTEGRQKNEACEGKVLRQAAFSLYLLPVGFQLL